MNLKKSLNRLLALGMTMALLTSSMSMAAAADVDDAKSSLADVAITQEVNGALNAHATHDFRLDGDVVSINYGATLKMTEEMAIYLQAREKNLMKADFNVTINMDLNALEFAGTDAKLKATFTSTFLKPVDTANIKAQLKGRDTNGVFTYELTVDRAWAQAQGSITVPVELIVYFDGTKAYGYEAAKAFHDEPMMYSDFTTADWMHEIKLSLAEMQVKAATRDSITTNPTSWRTVEANGTVEGTFAYISDPAASIQELINHENRWIAAGKPEGLFVTHMEFGDGADITGWKSNVVSTYLKRSTKRDITPDNPYLNTEDHFAYIVGMPDGLVHPEINITRAEVATIFFRMLKEDVRTEYYTKVNNYGDVKLTDWYNVAISTLSNLGVVSGMPDGNFHPTANITRGEFATMAVRFFNVNKDEPIEDAFTDIDGHWAQAYINHAYRLGLINGYLDGTFRPENNIGRAEAMSIVNNTLRRTPCKHGLLPTEQMITWPDNSNVNAWYYAIVQEATNSHEYVYFKANDPDHAGHYEDQQCEQWTKELPVRDWEAIERSWSEPDSSRNPGEIVKPEMTPAR